MNETYGKLIEVYQEKHSTLMAEIEDKVKAVCQKLLKENPGLYKFSCGMGSYAFYSKKDPNESLNGTDVETYTGYYKNSDIKKAIEFVEFFLNMNNIISNGSIVFDFEVTA